MTSRIEDYIFEDDDGIAFEFIELNKSHPTLGELYIIYCRDIELPKVESEYQKVWKSDHWDPKMPKYKSDDWYHALVEVVR